MATDYDAPRRNDTDDDTESLESLTQQTTTKQAQSPIEPDEAERAENHELPGADLSDETLTVVVVPVQPDEFTCSRCYLVHHISQQVTSKPPVCADCD